ncbi:MAG: hypothetical protein EOO68_33070 [Moraxellaceae bacterium]|nr:MAG: hypothetical protein EOO68_33070 [Moraxellaceae bacterium]
MNAIELLQLCEQYAVSVEIADSEHIAVEPIARLPSDVINQLKRHKLDIIAYLSQQRTSTLIAANDALPADNLNQAQQRALKDFYYILNIKRENLASKGYCTMQAAVSMQEYQTKLMRVIGINRNQVHDLMVEIIQLGYIAAHGSYLYEGYGIPRITDVRKTLAGEFLPRDASGQAFYDWFYANDRVH